MSDRTTVVVQLDSAEVEYFRFFRDNGICMQSLDGHWDLVNDRLIIERKKTKLMIDFLRSMSILRGNYFDAVKSSINKIEEQYQTIQ